MTDVVLIPWRGGERHRERNKNFVVDYYSKLNLPIYLGDSGHEKFNRGASRNAAAAMAGDWDIALFADADCIAELDTVRRAMHTARSTGKLVIAHDDFIRLSDKGTEKLIANPSKYLSDPWRMALYLTGETRLQRGFMPAGMIALSRASFDLIGGYVEFPEWGNEDSTILEDAERTVGVERLPGWMWHLWHPRDTVTLNGLVRHQEMLAEHRLRRMEKP